MMQDAGIYVIFIRSMFTKSNQTIWEDTLVQVCRLTFAAYHSRLFNRRPLLYIFIRIKKRKEKKSDI